MSSTSDKLAVLSAKLDDLASKANSIRHERKKQSAKPDELPTTSTSVLRGRRLTHVPDTPLQRIPYHLKYHAQRFAGFMAIKLREFRVLDRSVKMIVLFVLGFFLFVGVFAVRGHEERGYIHNDEREEYQEEYDSSEFGDSRFHKALFHPVFHARQVVDSMKTNFARDKFESSHATEKHPYSTKVSFECPVLSCVNVALAGAVGDGMTVNTETIQNALDSLTMKAQGRTQTLAFPPGRWLTGPLELKSNVKIVLDGPRSFLEAVKSTDSWPIDDWKEHPSLPSDDPTPIFRAFIHAYNQTNIEISGGGTINGHGDFWWDRKTDEKYSPSMRKKAHVPNLVHLVGCSDVKIENIVLTNSPHFTVRPQYCDKVSVSRIHISNPANSPGTNGVVFDSTSNSFLRDSFITTGDKEDAVAIKSGKDYHGRKANVPSKNIRVEHVTILGGHALSVGSEMSGGVSNIIFSDITFDGRNNKFGVGSARVKTMRGRGGVVDQITFQNIRGWNALYALELYEYYSKQDTNVGPVSREETPIVKNINFKNVHIEGIKRYAGVIAGLPEMAVSNLVIENVHLTNVHKGWNCHKFKECNWPGGGCSYGKVSDVKPELPDGCVLDQSMMPHRQTVGNLWTPAVPRTGFLG
jgi:polygalacturonase